MLAYAINVESPQLQPAAVLRGADDAGLTGVYIATTDKRLYLGTVTSPSGILALPCDDVTSLAIGDLRAAESDRQQETIAIRADRLLAVLTEARQTASRNRPTPAAPAPGAPATTVPGEAAEMTTPAGKSIC